MKNCIFLLILVSTRTFGADIHFQNGPTNPDSVLEIESLVFSIDHSIYPPRAKLLITTNNQMLETFVHASELYSAPILDKVNTCFISLSPGCIDEGESNKQNAQLKNEIVILPQRSVQMVALAESFLNMPRAQVDYYVLSEKPWHLNLESLDTKKTHYFVYGMKNGNRVLNANWTDEWRESLNQKQQEFLNHFNDMIVARRLIKGGMFNNYIKDFPTLKYFAFMKELRMYYGDVIKNMEQYAAVRKWVLSLDPLRTKPCDKILTIEAMR